MRERCVRPSDPLQEALTVQEQATRLAARHLGLDHVFHRDLAIWPAAQHCLNVAAQQVGGKRSSSRDQTRSSRARRETLPFDWMLQPWALPSHVRYALETDVRSRSSAGASVLDHFHASQCLTLRMLAAKAMPEPASTGQRRTRINRKGSRAPRALYRNSAAVPCR